jgi:hypothetical protein
VDVRDLAEVPIPTSLPRKTVSFLGDTPDDLTALFAVGLNGSDVHQVTPALYGIAFKHDGALYPILRLSNFKPRFIDWGSAPGALRIGACRNLAATKLGHREQTSGGVGMQCRDW